MILALTGVVVFWASAFIGIRAVGQTFSPGPFALGRLLVGTVTLMLIAGWRGAPRPRGTGAGLTVLFGVLWFGGYTVVLNAAGQRLDAGTAAMLVNIGPLLIALGAGLFLGEGFPRRLMVGLAVAFCGVVVIGTGGVGGHSTQLGVLLGVGAALLYAAGVLIQKVALRSADVTAATAWGCLAGAVVLLPFLPSLLDELAAAPTSAVLGMVYLGVVPTGIAFALWGYALARADAGQTAATTLAVPAVAVLMSAVLLSELPTLGAVIGGGMCLAGVILARRPVRRRRSRPA